MESDGELELRLPPKLIPVFLGEARYRGSFGGRGSAKTRTFAKMTAVWALRFAQSGVSGVILCAREFVKSLEESSFAEVKAAIQSEPWLEAHFELGETYIRTRRDIGLPGFVEYVFAGLRHNLKSIKSKALILLCWVDEAEGVIEEAWRTLIPTIREEGSDWESEIWVTWNPELDGSATDKRFRKHPPQGAKIVEMNYLDNPWFPKVLERERLDDFELRPDSYEHVWGGGYITTVEGAYFAKHIILCKNDGRVTNFSPDPLLTIKVHCDIGGTGKKSDHFSMVVDQFSGDEIHILDHYTAQGQTGAVHLRWLTKNGYTPDVAEIFLPHDGDQQDKVYDVSYKKFFEEAGYDVTVVPNQGTGAAMLRVERMRQLFRRFWFNERKTAALLKSLGWYHEKIDPERQIGLGPDHDWSSHDADAAGLMAITYEEPTDIGDGYLDAVPNDSYVA